MPKPSEDREFITSLARGLLVLQAFDREHPELTVSQAATRSGLNPSVVRRCLLTFQRLGYMGMQDRRYFLLPKIVTLGSTYLASARIEEVIQPILRDVVASFGDSASLGVLDGQDVLYVANFAARRLVRLTSGVGTRFPAFATSMGRILLAGLSPDELDAYFASTDFTAFTSHTITDVAQLRRIVEQVRRDDYVIVRDELEVALSALAVPVKLDGKTVAALNCSLYRGDENTFQGRIDQLHQAAAQVSDMLRRFPTLAHSMSYPRAMGTPLPTLLDDEAQS